MTPSGSSVGSRPLKQNRQTNPPPEAVTPMIPEVALGRGKSGARVTIPPTGTGRDDTIGGEPLGAAERQPKSLILGVSIAILAGLLLGSSLLLIGFGVTFVRTATVERVGPGAPATTASLAIDSNPKGALVFVDGEPTGLKTPATLEGLVPNARHQLRLEKRGFASRREQIELKAGANDLGVLPLDAVDSKESGNR